MAATSPDNARLYGESFTGGTISDAPSMNFCGGYGSRLFQ